MSAEGLEQPDSPSTLGGGVSDAGNAQIEKRIGPLVGNLTALDVNLPEDDISSPVYGDGEKEKAMVAGTTTMNRVLHPKEPWVDQMTNSRLLRPTVSLSIPPVSSYTEAERVRRCFLPGFCSGTIKKLPKKIKPGSIIKSKQEILLQNRMKRREGTGVGKNVLRNGYFSNIEYSYSEYDAEAQQACNEKEKNKLLIDSFGRKPFNVSNGRIHKRYEDMFLDCKDVLVDGGPPTEKITLENGGMLRSNDPTPVDPLLKTRPSFYPPALCIDLSNDVGRERIQHWMSEIYKELSSAWSRLKFTVKFTLKDELVVGFEVGDDVNIGALGGLLLKYMNNMAKHGLGSAFKLKRRGDRWNVYEIEEKEGVRLGKIVYCFDAPWVISSSLKAKKVAAQEERAKARESRKELVLKKSQDLFSFA